MKIIKVLILFFWKISIPRSCQWSVFRIIHLDLRNSWAIEYYLDIYYIYNDHILIKIVFAILDIIFLYFIRSLVLCFFSSSSPMQASCPAHFSSSTSYTWRRVQVMKLLIMQFSLISYHFIPLPYKYRPQHRVITYFHSVFLDSVCKLRRIPGKNWSTTFLSL
jgi:hypothetical protein